MSKYLEQVKEDRPKMYERMVRLTKEVEALPLKIGQNGGLVEVDPDSNLIYGTFGASEKDFDDVIEPFFRNFYKVAMFGEAIKDPTQAYCFIIELTDGYPKARNVLFIEFISQSLKAKQRDFEMHMNPMGGMLMAMAERMAERE